jgi:tetratricopeptide (TPR) repeat protein
MPKPEAELKITTAFWHFARGNAFVALNQLENAETELQAYQSLLKAIPAEAPIGNNTAHGVLKVGEQMLTGKIAFARGNNQTAMELMRKAVAADDAVSYNEPADWDIPTRESFGGMLLAMGNYSEAEQVFRAELAKHQRNGRALFGLVESLERQNKSVSAKTVRVAFEKAWQGADTQLSIEQLSGVALKPQSTLKSTLKFSDVQLKTGVGLCYGKDHSNLQETSRSSPD